MLLRHWVLHHAKLLVSRQDTRGAKPAHVFEDQESGGDEVIGEREELQEREVTGKLPTQICALVNKHWFSCKGAGKTRKGAGKGKRPDAVARDARDVRSGNCGRMRHSSAESMKAKRGPGERTWFNYC